MATAAVIWDVDGTLVDTAEQHFQAWQQIANELSYPFTRADFVATFGMRNPEIIRQLFNPTATDDECRAIGERKENYYRQFIRTTGVKLLPGVARLLADAAMADWLQAVGSSAPLANLQLVLSITQTEKYFQAIVCGDDVRRGKPDPEVFLSAANKLGITPERCLVIEDAVAGVQAAKTGKMKCIAVTLAGHHPADKLFSAGADLVVASLDQLRFEQIIQLLM